MEGMSSKEAAKEKEWRISISQAQKGDKAAKEKLLEQNTGLIYMVLKRFSGRGHDMEELFQVGAIGLIHAIERFDLEKEYGYALLEDKEKQDLGRLFVDAISVISATQNDTFAFVIFPASIP